MPYPLCTEPCEICAHPIIKGIVVDFILSTTFEEVDLNKNPCIMPSYRHILTLESINGHISISDFYTTNSKGLIVDLKNSAEPFSASGMKSCPTCRGPLRNLNRYSRIVRQVLIDEATKKFIVWANMEFIPLITRMQVIEAELRSSQKASDKLKGSRDHQISQIGTITRKENRYKTIIGLRREIKKFLQQVNEKEQPFGRIYDLVQNACRYLLLIKCDYTILLTFLNNRKGETSASSSSVQVDLSINKKECEKLIAESHSRNQPGNYRSLAEPGSELTQLLDKARGHFQLAHKIYNEYPGQTTGMKNELKDVKKMLRDSTFYMPVSNKEKAAYYCENGHAFTIRECGMPMETSQCPQCGSPVSGHDHRAVGGVRPATDLERQFGGLRF
ncbi:hypothetical protein BKA65DRAFT_608325 [Rhexocercosporidium sp. MPI-PUGE-AT-0058]|nr:hypothetical protein BKA65DRAFT_608325 [Rhexocercosporidium sp. MPI-PUGE-AT-0058]